MVDPGEFIATINATLSKCMEMFLSHTENLIKDVSLLTNPIHKCTPSSNIFAHVSVELGGSTQKEVAEKQIIYLEIKIFEI